MTFGDAVYNRPEQRPPRPVGRTLKVPEITNPRCSIRDAAKALGGEEEHLIFETSAESSQPWLKTTGVGRAVPDSFRRRDAQVTRADAQVVRAVEVLIGADE
jgi:hypothetical protein